MLSAKIKARLFPSWLKSPESESDSCPGKLGECPLLNEFREGLKKSISNHVNVTLKNDKRLCKTSRVYSASAGNPEKENVKMTRQNPNESPDKKRTNQEAKSNASRGVIRSTRAQDLRSQSNRDLLKPKTTYEKTRMTSCYLKAPLQKKKKPTNPGVSEPKVANRPNPAKVADEAKRQQRSQTKTDKSAGLPTKGQTKKGKSLSDNEEVSLRRQRTQEIINPKIVKKASSKLSAAGDHETPELKKSQTFFICKGTKRGERGDDAKGKAAASPAASDGNATDSDLPSPKHKPLTHNDSFCLIVKSSQNWAQKNRSDDEKWLRYGLSCEEKAKKSGDRGILKNSNYDLKSVDSLEKVDSEKIVRFSDELLRNKKVLKKLVRRKKRLQNFFTPAWYQKNKFFQKYLQALREKSVLLSDVSDTPDNLKPFRVPLHVKERHEAEMFGLYPSKTKTLKSHSKDAYSY